MRLLIPCSLALAAAFWLPSVDQDVTRSVFINALNPALLFPVLQTRMPTRHGDVPHLQTGEPTEPASPPKIKLDPVQLERDARELLELSQSVQPDIQAVKQGLQPKDLIEKLKRIQKLAKHLRGEIEP